ncbi:MAG: aminopeptidase [Flavobacterium sp.]|nr:aminopeptidase [Flavobacterium sp.]
MRSFMHHILLLACLGFAFQTSVAQHHSSISASYNPETHQLLVQQELTYVNQSSDTLNKIVLYDWNHAYSDKNSELGKRFSDEFVRRFHFAPKKELGYTQIKAVQTASGQNLNWNRLSEGIELLEINLITRLHPGASTVVKMQYVLQFPYEEFTHYGWNSKDDLAAWDCFLSPAVYENHQFITYTNANLDDAALASSSYALAIQVPENYSVVSNLDELKTTTTSAQFSGTNRKQLSLSIQKKSNFTAQTINGLTVITNIKSSNKKQAEKEAAIAQIVSYVQERIGQYPYKTITVTQADYDRNPFYGLNQLPSFISPFSTDLLFELQFLKTYTKNFLRSSLQLDFRKDHWVVDAIQLYTMMNYMTRYHPEVKMMGNLNRFAVLRSYRLINMDFNEQYAYYYLIMARLNLDQALGETKDRYLRFNEKIAMKYKAGLALKYLDSYTNYLTVSPSIQSFYSKAIQQYCHASDFEQLLRAQSAQNLDWFFNSLINSNQSIDYRFSKSKKKADTLELTLQNKTGTAAPIPVYGLKNKKVVYYEWFQTAARDTTFTVPRSLADTWVINYKNEVPEFNTRNNWLRTQSLLGNNRPFKFTLMKDIEDPKYNQLLFVPTVEFNLYDGIAPGLRLHNKTVLAKPIVFDVNPMYATLKRTVIGHFSVMVNEFQKNGNPFQTIYGMSGAYFHYAPDASYSKLNPFVTFYFREPDLRDNHRKMFTLRYNKVHKEVSSYVFNPIQNYEIYSLKYVDVKSEINHTLQFSSGAHLSNEIGKLSTEIQYREMYAHNRQIKFRWFTGAFLFNKNPTNYFDFGLSNPNDYLFEYDFFGRSETGGLFSQQYFMADGGFKSKIAPFSCRRWMSTVNVSATIWNWVDYYHDFGVLENNQSKMDVVYDGGISLSLVPDYFELFLPVYSSNGWDITEPQYAQSIRFTFTFTPKILFSLFTRKWF